MSGRNSPADRSHSPGPAYVFYPPPRRSSLSPSVTYSQRTPSPSFPQSPRIHSPPTSPLSPSFSRIQRVTSPPPQVHLDSRSSTPPLPFGIHGTPSIPPTPSMNSLSISTANRDSSTPLPGAAGLTGEYAERSAWERDEDEKSAGEKRCGMSMGKFRRKGAWLAILLVVGLIVIISLGAGLGVGLRARGQDKPKNSLQIPIEDITSAVVASTSAGQSHLLSSTAVPTNEPTSLSTKPSLSFTTTFSTSTTSLSTTTSFSDPDVNSFPTSTKLLRPSTQSLRACPTPSPCNASGCHGRNRDGELGWCTSGEHAGCGCTSICGSELGYCQDNGCGGANGFCEMGDWVGCPCLDS